MGTSTCTIASTEDKECEAKEAEDIEQVIGVSGQWLVRRHRSGSARSEGYYSLAPSTVRRKFRHLAPRGPADECDAAASGRNLRLHKRRLASSHCVAGGVSALQLRGGQAKIQFG